MAQSTEPNFLVSVLIPLISTIGGFLVSIIAIFLTSRQERIKSKEDAHREYEYEARKRLYLEFEPLLFRLVEQSEYAYNHIIELAGDPEEVKENLSSRDKYYLRATIYKLLVPIAIFRLMQNRLTLFDIRLNRYFSLQYSFAKCLYFSFTEDEHIAEEKPKIDYEFSYEKDPPYRKGINRGELDRVVDSLICFEQSSDEIHSIDKNQNVHDAHIITFGSFEDKYFRADVKRIDIDNYLTPLSIDPIDNFIKLFVTFGWEKREVLWRILIVQAILYCAIRSCQPEQENNRKVNIVSSKLTRIMNRKIVKNDIIKDIISDSKNKVKKDFHDEDIRDSDFEAASNYLKEWLKKYSVMSPSTGM